MRPENQGGPGGRGLHMIQTGWEIIGGVKAGLARSGPLWALERALWQLGDNTSLERSKARWETSEEAGFMVQERDDDGFGQEIEQQRRELWFYPPTMYWALYWTFHSFSPFLEFLLCPGFGGNSGAN